MILKNTKKLLLMTMTLVLLSLAAVMTSDMNASA